MKGGLIPTAESSNIANREGQPPLLKKRKEREAMLRIKFKYADAMSNWQWRTQECVMSSVSECIKVYGLGQDCDYEIISVEEVK